MVSHRNSRNFPRMTARKTHQTDAPEQEKTNSAVNSYPQRCRFWGFGFSRPYRRIRHHEEKVEIMSKKTGKSSEKRVSLNVQKKKHAIRTSRSDARRKAEGLIRVSTWVPGDRAAAMSILARTLVSQHRAGAKVGVPTYAPSSRTGGHGRPSRKLVPDQRQLTLDL